MPFGRVAVAVTPCGRPSRPQRVKSLSSKVRLRRGHTWPLFRKGLQASACVSDSPLLNSRAVQRPRHFLVSSSQPLPGVQDTAVPAVGAAFVSHHTSKPRPWPVLTSAMLATPCAGTPASTKLPTTSIRRPVPVSAQSGTPLKRRCYAHRVGRSGPGPGSRLPTAPRRSPSGSGSLRSPRPGTAGARHLHAQDRFRGQHSASLRVLGHWQTCRQRPLPVFGEYQRHLPRLRSCLQDCQQPRPPRKPTPRRQCWSDRSTPPVGRCQG